MNPKRITGLAAALVLAMVFVAVRSEYQSSAGDAATTSANQTVHDGHAHRTVDQEPEPSGHHQGDEDGHDHDEDQHAHDENDPDHDHQDHQGLDQDAAPHDHADCEGHDDHAEDGEHDEHAGHGGHDEHADESVVRLSEEERKRFGVEVAVAGAGSLATRIELPGKVVLDADRGIAPLRARMPASGVR